MSGADLSGSNRERDRITVAGIAGMYGAGKDLAAGVFAERGFLVIDVDALGHRALELRKREILERFGAGVIGPSGEVDRRALGGIVFSSVEERRALEAIVHPAMREEVAETIRTERGRGAAGRNVCINAALLFPMGLAELCDFVVWVKAPFLSRLGRTMVRDRLPLREALKRLLSQRHLRPQQSSRAVDIYTVKNSGTRERLREEIRKLLARKGL